MTFLLDINVLIALLDRRHVAHEAAHDWFSDVGHRSWATTPLTENGVIRIVSNPKYRNTPGSPALVAELVRTMLKHPGHRFWPDEISLVAHPVLALENLQTSAQVTDTYLLALARVRGGQLATFDRRLSPAAVRDGASALCLIEVGVSHHSQP